MRYRPVSLLLVVAMTMSIAVPAPAALIERPQAGTKPAKMAKRAVKQQASRRVNVKLKPGISGARLRTAGVRGGYRVVGGVGQLGWVTVEPTDSTTGARELALKVRSSGLARSAVAEVTYQPAATPTDPLYPMQWGFSNTGATGGLAGADARLEPAWDWSHGDGVTVAVIDTGIDMNHPDLAGKAWVNPDETAGNGVDDDANGRVDDVGGWDFYRNDATTFDEADGDKHGTHVAGTIAAATDNGLGGAGTASGARVMPLKFLGPMGGSDTNGAAAIVYAVDEGADVINCSWGGGATSLVLSDALAYAAARGVLVVCAAGNNGTDNDVTGFYPASYPATNVISVAALDSSDRLASYSNRGATSVDVGAPGSAIWSTQPRLGSTLLVDKAPYKAVYHAFPVESVTSQTQRELIIARSMAQLATTTAAPILVVDDSWPAAGGEIAGTRLSAYTSALAAAGYTNVTTWRRDTQGIPPADQMAGKVVVWFTGAASFGLTAYQSYGTLSSTERTPLATFLSGGGRLLISSGDLGYDMNWIGGTALTWYRTYLHAEYADDDPWTYSLSGRGSTPLEGVSAALDDPLRTSDGCDDVCAYDSYASVAADWYEYAGISGTSMAAPHVTGTLALMLARHGGMSAEQLKARLLSTARPVAALAGKTVTGGTIDAAAAVGTLPAPSALSANAHVGSVSLTWSNPTDSDFTQTRILASFGEPPSSPDDSAATLVYEGTGVSALHEGLDPGVAVHYAAFSRSALGRWSEAATISATPLSPRVSPDAFSMLWDARLTAAAPGVRANDPFADGTLAVVAGPAHGTLKLEQDGSFEYVPETGYFGEDVFTYSMTDDLGRVFEASATITVERFRLDSLSTSSATPGSRVTLTGTGFGAVRGDSRVTFAGTAAEIVEWTDTHVIALVPALAKPGYLGVVRDGRASNGIWFKPRPRLDALSTAQGAPGTLVTFSGAGFGATQGSGWVSFAGKPGIVISWTDTKVVAAVPEGASAGYAGIAQNGIMSNGRWFVPAPTPRLDALSCSSGAPGTRVTFTGSGFGATQGSGWVGFAGTPAVVVSWTDTVVVAIVPEGASAGYAGVAQNGVMSNGRWFVPQAAPVVTTLSAVSAAPGELLTITGTGFGATQGDGWATFGGISATVVSWSDTEVVAIVPAGTGPCYVGVVQRGIVSNGRYFVPLP